MGYREYKGDDCHLPPPVRMIHPFSPGRRWREISIATGIAGLGNETSVTHSKRLIEFNPIWIERFIHVWRILSFRTTRRIDGLCCFLPYAYVWSEMCLKDWMLLVKFPGFTWFRWLWQIGADSGKKKRREEWRLNQYVCTKAHYQ